MGYGLRGEGVYRTSIPSLAQPAITSVCLQTLKLTESYYSRVWAELNFGQDPDAGKD